MGVKFPLPWKGQSLCSLCLFLEAARGSAGIGHLLGSLPVPHLTRGCPEAAPRQLQLRATASEPLPFSGRTLCFLQTKAHTKGCAFFLRKTRVFPPFLLSPQPWVWGCSLPAAATCHLKDNVILGASSCTISFIPPLFGEASRSLVL